MAGLPWVSVGDNCRLTQCWRSAILSDFGAPPRQRTPRPLKCELRPHLRKSWRGRVHCQGRAKRARRVALTVDSSPPIHTQEGEADVLFHPLFLRQSRFCYDEQTRIVMDPDEEVRAAVGLVFRLFRETGTAFGVMQRFAESGLRFPKRSYGGAWDGKILWGRL